MWQKWDIEIVQKIENELAYKKDDQWKQYN